jgi:hypothetical protein
MNNISQWAAHNLPFLGLFLDTIPENGNRPMLTRIMEQSVVGLIAAVAGSYFAMHDASIRLEDQQRQLTESVTKIEKKIEEYAPIITMATINNAAIVDNTKAIRELEKSVAREQGTK